MLPLLTVLLASVGGLLAEPEDNIIIGQRRELHSEILDEDRKLHIYTPGGYEDDEKESYPVLYLLDGPYHFHHTTGLVQFLADNGRIPEMIVVAVGNTNRTRDLTPSAGEMGGKKRGGGGDKFLKFLSDELAPWVEKEYRTRPYRVLVGHSFGGLFGVHALITKPDFYDGIIAISPSLQWDEQHTVDAVETWLETNPKTDSAIYMTVGSEGSGLLGGTMKVSGLLSSKTPKGLRWEFQHLPEESHGSVPHRSTNLGLEFIFADWHPNSLELYEAGGWAAVEAHYEKTRPRFGYDKSVPQSAAQPIVRQFMGQGRLAEALAFVRKRDPKKHPFPPPFFDYLAMQLKESGDEETLKQCHLTCLERFPHHKAARKALVEMGVEVPEAPEEKKIEIPAKLLARYAGEYHFKPADASAIVSVKGDKLFVNLPGMGEPAEAVPLGKHRFRFGEFGAEASFTLSEGKPAERMTLHMGDREMPCPRVKAE